MPDIEQEISFDDVTLDSLKGAPVVEQQEETPDEPVDETPEELEQEEEQEEIQETKVEGIKEVRDAFNRSKKREEDLTGEIKLVNEVFEELGADAKTIAEVAKEYGGIEQMKIGTQLYKLVQDQTNNPEELLKQANEIIPETVEALVLHIADAVEADFSKTYQQKLFGRELNEDQIQAVRDFIDFGATHDQRIPQEFLTDEFGDPLPEKTQAMVRNMWERNTAQEQKLADLSKRVSSQLDEFGDQKVNAARDNYMITVFKPITDIAVKIGLDKIENKIHKEESFAALESLTYRFFQMNPAADRALQQAIETLGKNDASSKAKHLDATRKVSNFAKVASEKAASFLATQSATKAQKADQSTREIGETVKSGVKSNAKAPATQDDSWGDITVNSLKLSGKRGRR